MNETREEKFGDSPNSPENDHDEVEEFVDNDEMGEFVDNDEMEEFVDNKEMEEFVDNNGRDNGEVLPEIRSTEEILRRVQRELCLIKLCWSDIPIPKDLYAQSLPDTYRCVNDKERLLLWYAENFRRQIHAKDAKRRPLLLACENECGVQKFTSTGIRRSTLPYPELYTWRGCAQFISNHVTYQPLDEEFIMPERLCSPTWVLHFQNGNSFECATLLVSLLLGQSYNAFVVSGYASREQAICDMSRRNCPYLPEQKRTPPPAETPKIVKYQLKAPPDFRSQFLLELEERERKKIDAELQRQEEEQRRMIAEFERPQPDKYFGHRIHAWVVILPKDKGPRSEEITEPIFIEPASGISYNPADEDTNLLYLGIESIWNDQNYWVNMQPREKGCAEINWDLSKVEFWEHLLPGEPPVAQEDMDEIEKDMNQDKHLDMPASYVNEIQIHSLDFERLYPQGNKTIFYKKAKVELYAPYFQMDGLIQRVTVYEDYEYNTPVQCYEKYLKRSDCLTESRKDFDTDTVTDFFERGRSDQCKVNRYLASDIPSIDNERTIDFYDSVRFDGLSRIEMDQLYLTQYYTNREDFLYYRHTQFSIDKNNPKDGIHFRHISKIIEKYHRNKEIPASQDVAVREFTMIENEIRIKFHYDKDRSFRATRTFIKPPMADRGDRLVFDPAMTYGYNPDPTAPPEKNLDLFYDLDKHLKDEDRSIIYVRDAEIEIMGFLKRRMDENSNPQLVISLFNKNRIAETTLAESEDAIKSPSQRDDIAQEINPLGPYLAQIGNPPYISKAEAYLLRDECLNDFKQLSIDKANYILRTIEKRASELEKMQILLTQSVDLSKAEEEQMLAKISEITFNLHVLDTYLNWHRNQVPQRYRILTDRLQQNPYLQVLKKN